MQWQKIIEQTVTVVLSMVLTAFGGATVWGITTILQHERTLIQGQAEFETMKKELEAARQRDEELITMMAEEMKKLQKAVEASCEHLVEKGDEKPEFPMPQPIPPVGKDPKKTFDKFFPPEQRTDDYQRILRDKYRQRTEQNQQIEK